MNGIAFANLPQLVQLDLRLNVCIGKLFEIDLGSNTFRRKISRSCASAEVAKKLLSCTTSIACDEMRDEWFHEANSDASHCCELDYGTFIDAPDYTFTADTADKKFDFLIIKHQQNVEFLPVMVHDGFLMLKFYWIVNTVLPKILKKNFEKLYELKMLTLDRNQIEVIKSDTFEDLVQLEWIQISTRLHPGDWKFIFCHRIHSKPTPDFFKQQGFC